MTTRPTIEGNHIRGEKGYLALTLARFRDTYREMGKLASGSVLEIGYGLGVLHAELHDNPAVREITVLELWPGVALQCQCCTVRVGDWRELLLGRPDARYDTITYDVFDGETDLWPASAADRFRPWLVEGGRVLRFNHGDTKAGWVEVHV